MYTKTAKFYDDLYSFKDFEPMARKLERIIEHYHPDCQSVLEVACGTGQFLKRLQRKYQVVGVDINPDMLSVAATQCPGVPLHQADMVEFDIGRRFDVIACLFSSIAYVGTVERLRRAVERMVAHLNPQGVLLIEPFFTPETCWNHDLRLNVYDGPERKIAWMYLTEVVGKLAVSEVHYLIGERTGVEHLTERHEFGLFTDGEYREALERLGLDVHYDRSGACGRGMYIGVVA